MECPHCHFTADDTMAHVDALHKDEEGNLIASTVVDKVMDSHMGLFCEYLEDNGLTSLYGTDEYNSAVAGIIAASTASFDAAVDLMSIDASDKTAIKELF